MPPKRSPASSEFGAEPGHPLRPAFTADELNINPYGTDESGQDDYDVALTPYGRIGPRGPWEPLP